MPSPAERIALARASLIAAGIPDQDAALDAEVLARHVLAWDRAALLAHGREPAPDGFDDAFDALIARRAGREPVAQIVGHREFWGREFEVTREVLIPRPETELIVDEALEFARVHRCSTVADVGTGSGCIAVSVACELPAARVTATDTSEAALVVARGNAERHGVSDRVTLQATDLLDGVPGQFDLILSNPPYIPEPGAASLQLEVARFEPPAALFAGTDGLAVIRRLLQEAAPYLAPQGQLIVEFGIGQGPAIGRAAEAFGWTIVRLRQDLQGIPRTAVLRR
jgi:release factor glutamine methyltransferase